MNKSTIFLLLAAAAIPATGRTGQVKPAGTAAKSGESVSPALRRSIDDSNRKWSAAMIRGDAAGIAGLYASDGMEVATETGKSYVGHAAIEQRWAAAFADKVNVPIKATVESTAVTQDGDTALETGRFSYLYTPPRSVPVEVKGKYCVVWRQGKDGSWKIFVDMALPN